MAEKKAKHYVIENSQLMVEWNWEKNNELGIDPQKLTCGSGKIVWWKCSKGHEWQADIHNRNAGNGCPYCSNKAVISGVNDLYTVNPALAEEWNYERNGKLTPADVVSKSSKKVWWRCGNGHEWQAVIGQRSAGNDCPYCSGRYVVTGVNDLKTVNPSLAEEWNFKKNPSIRPEDVTVNSGKKVWWQCKKGHEWQATVHARNRGAGCPVCSSGLRTSFPEYALVYYFKKCGIDVIQTYKELGYEIDLFIPSLKTAIEYDGYLWHQDKIEKDLEKNVKCKADGIRLYRIREELPTLNDSSIDYIVQRNHSNLSKTIEAVVYDICGINIEADIQRDFIAIENLQEHLAKDRSIAFTDPALAKEWNYEKNGSLLPEHVTSKSHKKVWWKCEKGHEWQAKIDNRAGGKGCPFCSGRFAISGVNDLQTVNPTLAAEWNYDKNEGLTPSNVLPNSSKNVWWICENGHEWKARIAHRHTISGCPYCSGLRILSGYNDLATKCPDVVAEWDYAKNHSVDPTRVGCANSTKVWWKCRVCGHEYEMTIAARIRLGSCPKCAREKRKKKD